MPTDRGVSSAGRRARRLAPLAGLLALGGCYTYVATPPGALPAGSRVRIALTEAGSAALQPVVGSSVTGIEGSLERRASDTVVVRPDRLLTTAGVDVAWTGGSLTVPADWQRGIDQRRLAGGRTALLVAGGVAASVGLIALIRGLGDAGGDPGGGGPGPILSRVR